MVSADTKAEEMVAAAEAKAAKEAAAAAKAGDAEAAAAAAAADADAKGKEKKGYKKRITKKGVAGGKVPKEGDNVQVMYKGLLEDGTVFDSAPGYIMKSTIFSLKSTKLWHEIHRFQHEISPLD